MSTQWCDFSLFFSSDSCKLAYRYSYKWEHGIAIKVMTSITVSLRQLQYYQIQNGQSSLVQNINTMTASFLKCPGHMLSQLVVYIVNIVINNKCRDVIDE